MDFPRKDTLMEQFKALLDVKDSDTAMKFTLDKVIKDVSIYCNIRPDEIPQELDHTIISIALTFTKTHDLLLTTGGDANGVPSNLQTITEGTTTTTFKPPSEVFAQVQAVNTITDDYRDQLNHFRKLQL